MQCLSTKSISSVGRASILWICWPGFNPALGNEISIVGKIGLATGVNYPAPLGDGMTCGLIKGGVTLTLINGDSGGMSFPSQESVLTSSGIANYPPR